MKYISRMIQCQVDDYVPIPTEPTKPYKNVFEHAKAACIAALVLEQNGYTGQDRDPEETRKDMRPIMYEVASGRDPTVPENFMDTPMEAILVHQILSKFENTIVREAQQIRNYVTNRLIIESDTADAKTRIRALELLGKISDVGLFTERSEITVNNKSDVELVTVLKEKLRKLVDVSDANIVREVKQIDV